MEGASKLPWISQFGSRSKLLIPEKLTNVGHSSSLDGSIGQYSHIVVHEKMSVGSSAFVVSWEDRFERYDTISISFLNPTEKGGVPATIGNIASFVDATVDSGGVCVPDIDIEAFDGEAGGDIEVLNLKKERNSFLTFGDILADTLTSHVVRAVGDFRRQNARCIGAEDCGLGSVYGIVIKGCGIVVDCFVDFESSKITTKLLGFYQKLVSKGHIIGESQ